jgi:pimeloyl-ACP methyl ester carboxylesterase
MNACKERFFCVAFDLPAHGASPYSKGIIQSTKESIESLGKNPIIVGYSMGGRLAFALEKQMELRALIAISSHTGLPSLTERLKRKKSDALIKTKLQNLSSEEFLSTWYESPVFASLKKDSKLLSSLLKKRRYKNKEELSLILEEMSLAHQPVYNSFSCPSFFLYGKEDIAYQTLYKNLTCKKGIPLASHALLEEKPLEVAEEILKFLQKEALCKQL